MTLSLSITDTRSCTRFVIQAAASALLELPTGMPVTDESSGGGGSLNTPMGSQAGPSGLRVTQRYLPPSSGPMR